MEFEKADIEWLLMMIVMLIQKFPIDIEININIGKQKPSKKRKRRRKHKRWLKGWSLKKGGVASAFNVQILSSERSFGNGNFEKTFRQNCTRRLRLWTLFDLWLAVD